MPPDVIRSMTPSVLFLDYFLDYNSTAKKQDRQGNSTILNRLLFPVEMLVSIFDLIFLVEKDY